MKLQADLAAKSSLEEELAVKTEVLSWVALFNLIASSLYVTFEKLEFGSNKRGTR